MPIYDFDGTTHREIGKAYDFDGVTHRQQSKTYDNDGITDRLLYAAETPVFDPGLSDPYCTALTGGYSVALADLQGEYTFATINSSMIQAYGSSGAGPHRSYMVISSVNAIDLGRFSKFELTGQISFGSYVTCAIGFSASRVTRGGQITNLNGTTALNIVDLNGSYYLNIYMYTDGGGISAVSRMTKGLLK